MATTFRRFLQELLDNNFQRVSSASGREWVKRIRDDMDSDRDVRIAVKATNLAGPAIQAVARLYEEKTKEIASTQEVVDKMITLRPTLNDMTEFITVLNVALRERELAPFTRVQGAAYGTLWQRNGITFRFDPLPETGDRRQSVANIARFLESVENKEGERTFSAVDKENVANFNDLKRVMGPFQNFLVIHSVADNAVSDALIAPALIKNARAGQTVRLSPLNLGHTDLTPTTQKLIIAIEAYRQVGDLATVRKLEKFGAAVEEMFKLFEKEGAPDSDRTVEKFWRSLRKQLTSRREVNWSAEHLISLADGKGNYTIEIQIAADNQGVGRTWEKFISRVIDIITDAESDALEAELQRAKIKGVPLPDFLIDQIRSSPTFFEDLDTFIYSLIDPKIKDRTKIHRKSRGSLDYKINIGHIVDQIKPKEKKSTVKLRKKLDTKKSQKAITNYKTQTKPRTQEEKRSQFNPLALQNLINQKLPPVVRSNMGAPGLVNRTGRFSESVRVVDIMQTPQGFPSFGYFYDMQRYGIFEKSRGRAPWATPERDPRPLIDKSIRDIAKDLQIGRLYTRRVA